MLIFSSLMVLVDSLHCHQVGGTYECGYVLGVTVCVKVELVCDVGGACGTVWGTVELVCDVG